MEKRKYQQCTCRYVEMSKSELHLTVDTHRCRLQLVSSMLHHCCAGFKKTWFKKKKAQPTGFYWAFLGFLNFRFVNTLRVPSA